MNPISHVDDRRHHIIYVFTESSLLCNFSHPFEMTKASKQTVLNLKQNWQMHAKTIVVASFLKYKNPELLFKTAI